MNFLLLLLTLGSAQTPAPQSPPATTSPPATAAQAQPRDAASYVIGPQDQLSITVYDEPDLTNRYRVDDAGFISFPLISRIAAAGLTVVEFEDRLRSTLASAYIRYLARLRAAGG